MSDVKVLMFALAGILLFGTLFTNIAGNFIDSEEDLNNTWVDNYSIDTIASFPITFIQFPISGVTILIDFMDGDFWEWIGNRGGTYSFPLSVNVSGTGTSDGKTLDGIYKYSNDVPNESIRFWHEDDSTWITFDRRRVVELYYSYSGGSSVNITDIQIIESSWLIDYEIYNMSNIEEEERDSTYNITFQKTADYTDFNNESKGYLVLADNVEDHIGYKTNAEKVFNFFEKTKENFKDSIRMFGLIPQEIGLPILLAIFIGIIYIIIKLFPFT